jgi:hypothetical protein
MSSEHPTIYTGHTGCNVEIDGEHGRVTGIHKDGKHVVGAFVHVPPESSVHQAPGHMLYVALGRKVIDGAGERHEVLSARLIDRDEFDRLNTLDQLRRDLGWQS